MRAFSDDCVENGQLLSLFSTFTPDFLRCNVQGNVERSEFGRCVKTKGKVVVNSRDTDETEAYRSFFSKEMMNDFWPSQFSIVHVYLRQS